MRGINVAAMRKKSRQPFYWKVSRVWVQKVGYLDT